ncbi:MAG: RnfH family protein [Methylococcaceae bacterium]|nr:RnfH family protein [Methylococcaceae bacterium]MCI0667089.1 RnfH family protein [Methylococcaceae bacterium]MCI0733854.1 RnfH family protein [Methylococcaceae bacterium]
MSLEQRIRIEVAHARPERQVVLTIDLKPGATVKTAIECSGILEQFPEIDLARNKVGIFGSVCGLDRIITSGDRVEIYRPLLQDPKDARRRRAAKNVR